MKTKKTAVCGVLTALAFILSYVESLVPAFFAVPGMKLGLTNLVVLAALYIMDKKTAFVINVVRIILVSFTFGSMFSMLYSLSGGILSFVVMSLLYSSKKFGIIGVSVAGGVAHNLGQIITACFVLSTGYVMYYFPVLCISGTLAGCVIGLIGGLVLSKLPREMITKS